MPAICDMKGERRERLAAHYLYSKGHANYHKIINTNIINRLAVYRPIVTICYMHHPGAPTIRHGSGLLRCSTNKALYIKMLQLYHYGACCTKSVHLCDSGKAEQIGLRQRRRQGLRQCRWQG